MQIDVAHAFYQTKEKNYTQFRMHVYPYYVILHFKDPMLIKLDGEEIITDKNSFVLYEPNYCQDYSLYSGEFVYDCVWFAIDDSDEFLSRFPIPINKPFYLKEMVDLDDISLISSLLIDRASDNDIDIEEHFIKLLERISQNAIKCNDNNKSYLQTAKQLIAIRKDIIVNPENKNVEQLAKNAYMSVSVFTQQYKNLFGISPGTDIHILTIEKAKKLLKDRNRSITEIAGVLGYSSAGNFIRAFKKQVGITPFRYKSVN